MDYKIHYKDELEHGGFKYIDKYFKNGKWQYVYEETKDKVKGAAQKVADTAKNVVTTKKYVGTDANSKRVDPDGSKGKSMGAAYEKAKVEEFFDGKSFDNKGASKYFWEAVRKDPVLTDMFRSNFGKTMDYEELSIMIWKIPNDVAKSNPQIQNLLSVLDRAWDTLDRQRIHGADRSDLKGQHHVKNGKYTNEY